MPPLLANCCGQTRKNSIDVNFRGASFVGLGVKYELVMVSLLKVELNHIQI